MEGPKLYKKKQIRHVEIDIKLIGLKTDYKRKLCNVFQVTLSGPRYLWISFMKLWQKRMICQRGFHKQL